MSKPDLEVIDSDQLGEPWDIKAKEVAEHLGMSRKEVYRIPEEHLPYAKIGRRRRYRASDVQSFIQERVQDGVA